MPPELPSVIPDRDGRELAPASGLGFGSGGPKPSLAAPPAVRPGDLYAALLADARKPATRAARVQDTLSLARFLAARGLLPSADPEMACALVIAGGPGPAAALATAYVAEMQGQGLAASTINRRLATLRRVVKLARRFGLIDWSLEADGLKAGRGYRDTSGPGRDGMARLIAQARAEAVDPRGLRNLALVSLLYTGGLRRNEAAGLDREHVDLDGNRVLVLGKGRHDRQWLPMGATAAEAIRQWLAERTDDEPALFIRWDNARTGAARLTADGVHHVLQQLGRRAGLARPLAPHKLRHASITRLAERTGGDLPRIQQFSRHSKVETVSVYVDNQRDEAAKLAGLLDEDLG